MISRVPVLRDSGAVGFLLLRLYPDNKLCIKKHMALYLLYPVVNINYRHNRLHQQLRGVISSGRPTTPM